MAGWLARLAPMPSQDLRFLSVCLTLVSLFPKGIMYIFILLPFNLCIIWCSFFLFFFLFLLLRVNAVEFWRRNKGEHLLIGRRQTEWVNARE